jgi:hypothetical protein
MPKVDLLCVHSPVCTPLVDLKLDLQLCHIRTWYPDTVLNLVPQSSRDECIDFSPELGMQADAVIDCHWMSFLRDLR